MKKILTATATVLTTWLGVNEIASKESEADKTYFIGLLKEGYRVKLATSTTLKDMIFVTYVMEKEVEDDKERTE